MWRTGMSNMSHILLKNNLKNDYIHQNINQTLSIIILKILSCSNNCDVISEMSWSSNFLFDGKNHSKYQKMYFLSYYEGETSEFKYS